MSKPNLDRYHYYLAQHFVPTTNPNTAITATPWTPELARNLAALLLAPPLLTLIIDTATKRLEHSLLRHFPELSHIWVFTGPDSATNKLQRRQKRVLHTSFLLPVLLRWPGWWVFRLHVWQCVGVVFAAVLVAEIGLVLALEGLVWYLWIAQRLMVATGWLPMENRRFVHGHEGRAPPVKLPPVVRGNSLAHVTPMRPRPRSRRAETWVGWFVRLLSVGLVRGTAVSVSLC